MRETGRFSGIAFLSVFLANCGALMEPDEEFTFARMDQVNPPFKLNGYYYTRFPSTEQGAQVERESIHFFFRNGIHFYCGSPTLAEVASTEEEIRTGVFYRQSNHNKSLWGIWKMADSKIVDEGWVNPNGTHLVIRDSFRVADESTLVLFSTERIDGSKSRAWNETYRFRSFSPKPESTVAYIR